MEKHFWTGLGILAALLALSVCISLGMKRAHAPGAEAFRQAAQLALAGELEQGRAFADAGRQRWYKSRAFTACVADHSPMDQVEDLLAEMDVFAKAEDAEHFAACCNQLAKAVEAMYDAHRFNLWNLL